VTPQEEEKVVEKEESEEEGLDLDTYMAQRKTAQQAGAGR